jgi:hypothetical protein
LGKAAGLGRGFFSGLGATIRGKGATKKEQPFFGFLGGRKKTEKLGKKNCFAPTKLPKCPFLGNINTFLICSQRK